MVSSSSTPDAVVHTHAVAVRLGDDVTPFGFQIKDTAATAMDADDYTLTAQIRTEGAAATIAETWTLVVYDNADDEFVDPDRLRVVFSMTDTEVAALGVGNWVWDLQVDGPTGKWTPIVGTLTVTQDVTRP